MAAHQLIQMAEVTWDRWGVGRRLEIQHDSASSAVRGRRRRRRRRPLIMAVRGGGERRVVDKRMSDCPRGWHHRFHRREQTQSVPRKCERRRCDRCRVRRGMVLLESKRALTHCVWNVKQGQCKKEWVCTSRGTTYSVGPRGTDGLRDEAHHPLQMVRDRGEIAGAHRDASSSRICGYGTGRSYSGSGDSAGAGIQRR